MRSLFAFLVSAALLYTLGSCRGKDKNSSPGSTKDSTIIDSLTTLLTAGDSALGSAKPFIEKELALWAQSFTGFHVDSLKMTHTTKFEELDYGKAEDMSSDYELFKPSFSYSPDSSQLIDLYSAGISLEKRGKKIIAIGDVDMAVTLSNTKTKEWKRIAFFGPSAAIEEAVWTSPSSFILTGIMHNDAGEKIPIMMLGDTESKTFLWFEAVNTKRPESSNYEASGMKKLKIDEWE